MFHNFAKITNLEKHDDERGVKCKSNEKNTKLITLTKTLLEDSIDVLLYPYCDLWANMNGDTNWLYQ
jgi:hypothetical protein